MWLLLVLVFIIGLSLRWSSSSNASHFFFSLLERVLLVDLLVKELLEELELLHCVLNAQRKVAELLVQVPVELLGRVQ